MAFRLLWLIVVALMGSIVSTPTHALVVVTPPEFIIYEGAFSSGGGFYAIKNNSNLPGYDPAWVIGFAVTNPAAATGFASTEQTGWVAGSATLLDLSAFGYADQSWFNGGAFDGTPVLSNDIGPDQFSSLFFWGPGAVDSIGIIEFVGSNGISTTRPFGTTVTPLPPAWTMMLMGLIAFGYIGHRRNKRVPAIV